jgi:release factor glutamine methyltransferase
LIPRPETEGLVDRALALDSTGIVLDVGTGTGCIALALRAEGRYRTVIAVDSSPAALGVARENRARLELEVELARSDLTTACADGSIDLLVSNPPYVSRAEYAVLDRAVRDYEPRSALETESGGLWATERVLADGARVVRPGGAAVIEIAATRAAECAALARQTGWRDVRIDDDLFGRPRYLVARREEPR